MSNEARTVTANVPNRTLVFSGGELSLGNVLDLTIVLSVGAFDLAQTYSLTMKIVNGIDGLPIGQWVITLVDDETATVSISLDIPVLYQVIRQNDYLGTQWSLDSATTGPIATQTIAQAVNLRNTGVRPTDTPPTNLSLNTYTDAQIDDMLANISAGTFNMAALAARETALGTSTLLAVQEPGETVPKKAGKSFFSAWFNTVFEAYGALAGHLSAFAHSDIASNSSHRLTVTGNPHGTTAADLGAIPTSQKGAANGVAPLGSDSLISATYLPAIALTDTYVVASEVAQLALTVQKGDVAVRSDENKSYVHNGGIAGTMADWTLLRTPTDVVLSVAGQVGTISKSTLLTALNVTEGAEPNVNADWNAAEGDAAILNKPTLGTAAAKNVPATGDAGTTEVVLGTDTRLTNARTPAAHAASHTNGADDIQSATASQAGLATAAQISKLDGIEAAADVTDATNVSAAGALMKSVVTTAGDRIRATASATVERVPCTVALAEATAGGWSPALKAGAHHTVTRSGILTGITPSGLEIGEGCSGVITGAYATTTIGVTADVTGALADIAGASVGWVIWREASGYRMGCWAKA